MDLSISMLSEDIKKELDNYNQEKKAQYKPTCPRMAKVHQQDHEVVDSPDNPEPDLENQLQEDSYPMQDTDIEDLLESHGHTLQTWHPHTISQSILFPLMGLY